MSNIYGFVQNQNLTVTIPAPVVGDSVNYISAEYRFSDDWDDVMKIAFFKDVDNNVIYTVVLVGDKIPAENGVNLTPGKWATWLVGEKTAGGSLLQRITTTVCGFTVIEGGVIDGVPFEFSPSLGEQILAEANEALAIAKELERRANAGEFGGVQSVNGYTGVVDLTAGDVGALPSSVEKLPNPEKLTFTGAATGVYDGSIPLTIEIPKGGGGGGGGGAVDSVNGKTGAVVLSAEDVGALPDTTVIPTKLPNPQKLTFTGAATGVYDGSSPVSVTIPDPIIPPVTSVNEKTGAVVLSAEDVGALPDTTVIPTKLPNPQKLTFTGAATGVYDGSSPVSVTIPDPIIPPVTSVNEKTGAVVLSAEDVGALPGGGDINMNEHNIHNVGEIDLTYLSIGATIGNTENARITGTSDGKAAVVKDNTQSTFVPLLVGEPTADNEAATRKFVLDTFDRLALYPVGAIYISTSSASPASLFGGTWTRIKGRYLLGTGTPEENNWDGWGNISSEYNVAAGTMGGEDRHTLLESELPELSGDINFHGSGAYGTVVADATGAFTPGQILPQYRDAPLASGATSGSVIHFQIGGGNSHNNMPPYLAVYMWRRIA